MKKLICKNCGNKIYIRDEYLFREGKCPKCKTVFIISETNNETFSIQSDNDNHILNDTSDLTVPHSELKSTDKVLPDYGGSASDRLDLDETFKIRLKKEYPQSRLPWVIDIFLYPLNKKGLTNLCIYAFPLAFITIIVISVLNSRPMDMFEFEAFLIFPTVGLCTIAYLFIYLKECVIDSATGGIRAIGNIITIPLDGYDLLSNLWELIVITFFTFAPVIVYSIYISRIEYSVQYAFLTHKIFWVLFGYGILIYPIVFLAYSLFNSSSSYNPLIWFASIFSTFFQYLRLVLFLNLLSGIFVWVSYKIIYLPNPSIINILLFYIVIIYMLIIDAHLLGRFFYKYRDKLNWAV